MYWLHKSSQFLTICRDNVNPIAFHRRLCFIVRKIKIYADQN